MYSVYRFIKMFIKMNLNWLIYLSISDTEYVGCYADDEDRDLTLWISEVNKSYNKSKHGNNNPVNCMAYCEHYNREYAGLQVRFFCMGKGVGEAWV